MPPLHGPFVYSHILYLGVYYFFFVVEFHDCVFSADGVVGVFVGYAGVR